MNHEGEPETKRYTGGCHCGRVRYEARIAFGSVSRCNCSICTKMNATGFIVKPDAFRLLSGEEALGEYQWAGRTQRFVFCKHCGIHSFGYGNLPQLGGEYVRVNVNCLEGVEPEALDTVYWDGRHENWEAGPRMTPWPRERVERPAT